MMITLAINSGIGNRSNDFIHGRPELLEEQGSKTIGQSHFFDNQNVAPYSSENDTTTSPPSFPDSKIPNIPKPYPMRRFVSEPVQSKRRSIFGGNVWGQTSQRPSPCPCDSDISDQASVEDQQRGEMVSKRPSFNDTEEIRRLVRPPPDRFFVRPHFVDIDQLPESSTQTLPDLPYPLRRFFENGVRTELSGVYPLVSPSPILRQSSYGQFPNNTKNGSFDSDQSNGTPVSSMQLRSFNLTNTPHYKSRKFPDLPNTPAASSSHSDSTDNQQRKVQFDPRVTVTEYEDDVPRHWFTNAELEKFKWETVHIVRRYLMSNPSMIDDYNQPYLEPITGKYRRRALFSIPALSANADEIFLEMNRACFDQMAKKHVKNILIAARNRLCLDLLAKSLQTIFPHAQIAIATSGEEAIRLFVEKADNSGFDLVFADGRLNRSMHNQVLSMDRLELSNAPKTKKKASLAGADISIPPPHIPNAGMSGAALFQQILELCQTFENAEVSLPVRKKNCPILIGLSTAPETEGKDLMDSGASLVWRLPPPRMDENLRDELVSTLIHKRHAMGNEV